MPPRARGARLSQPSSARILHGCVRQRDRCLEMSLETEITVADELFSSDARRTWT
ncbi:hypothetical protein JOB18_022215 [Solea senegalensis]|uniref:Uncharacterized protein n=1 Tax=Solea senegalensis TaxID=28829 RepID=A0AAV6RY23_SOLSE|nr:hypothetical protein JOB18_022215 [Solea senegalensis]